MRYVAAVLLFVMAAVGAAFFVGRKNATKYLNLGNKWFHKGDHDRAIANYTKAIHLDPQLADAFSYRGTAWFSKGDYDRAIADYTEAISLNPQYAKAFHNRGVTWFSKGDYDKAIADCSEAIHINPNLTWAFHRRGVAWFSKGEHDKAIADYDEAIRLDPQDAYAFHSRAWILATCPDARFRNGSQAVQDATRACELTDWKDSASIGTLSAACAEAGDFPKAIKWIMKAMSMDDTFKEIRAEMLALFEAGEPYRDEQRE